MFTRYGQFVVRRRKAVLIATFAFVLGAGAVGGGVADKLTTGGFIDPGAESTRAADLLEREFASSDPNVVLLVTARRGGRRRLPARAARRPRAPRWMRRIYDRFGISESEAPDRDEPPLPPTPRELVGVS